MPCYPSPTPCWPMIALLRWKQLVWMPSSAFFTRIDQDASPFALDLEEELRAPFADRLVLTLINNRIIQDKHFDRQESGTVLLNDDGRKLFLKHWQEKKRDEITHPFLKEKMPWGLVPYVQSLLLARCIRGDVDEYPPFLWK